MAESETYQLILSELNVTNGNTETQDLLELELDGGSNFENLAGQIFDVRDGSRELSGC